MFIKRFSNFPSAIDFPITSSSTVKGKSTETSGVLAKEKCKSALLKKLVCLATKERTLKNRYNPNMVANSKGMR